MRIIVSGLLYGTTALLFSISTLAEIVQDVKKLSIGQADSRHTLAFRAEEHEVIDEWRWVEYTWTELVCDDDPDAPSAHWNDYERARTRDEREDWLSKNIQGIGISSAEAIEFEGGFNPIPDNWESFKNAVRALRARTELNDLYYNVVTKYGSENKRKLYSAVACRSVEKTGYEYKNFPIRKLVDVHKTTIELIISGVQLLSGEKELLTVTWGGDNVTVQSELNDYTILNGGRGLLQLTSRARRAVRPVADDFVATLSKENGRLTLSFSDRRGEELARLSPEYKVHVSFKVRENGGFCRFGKDLVASSFTTATGTGHGKIDLENLGAGYTRGRTIRVTEIQFERSGTPYFSGATGQAQTGEIQY